MVDARYLEASVPATKEPTFEVHPDTRVVSVNDLPTAARPGRSYSVLGAGKTAVDACMWLLDNEVDPGSIRWVRPRDAWFHDRRDFQPLAQVGAIMSSIARDAEAGARDADDADRNRLCPPNPYPSGIDDWPGMTSRTWRGDGRGM